MIGSDDRRLTRTVWVLAFAVAAVGAVVFVYSGSQLGIISVVLGVPAAIVASIILYVRTSRSVSMDTRSDPDHVARMAEETGQRWARYSEKRREIASELPEGALSTLAEEETAVRSELDAQGIRLVDGEVTVDASMSPRLTELQSLRDRIDDLGGRLDGATVSAVQGTLDRLDGKLEQLEASGVVDAPPSDWQGPTALEGVTDARRALEVLRSQRETLVDPIETAAETVTTADRLLATSADQGRDQARAAVDAAGRGDVEAGLDAVISAARAVETDLSDDLRKFRATLEEILNVTLTAERFLDASLVGDLERLHDRVDSVDSVVETGDLYDTGQEVWRLATESVRQLEAAFDDRLGTINDSAVPREFHYEPRVDAEQLRSSVEAANSLTELSQAVSRAVDRMVADLERLSRRADVVEGYPGAEPVIDRRLASGGTVSASDLDLTTPTLFMHLYSLRHDDVQYDADRERLVATDADGGVSDE